MEINGIDQFQDSARKHLHPVTSGEHSGQFQPSAPVPTGYGAIPWPFVMNNRFRQMKTV
jgi:hypothetical protein